MRSRPWPSCKAHFMIFWSGWASFGPTQDVLTCVARISTQPESSSSWRLASMPWNPHVCLCLFLYSSIFRAKVCQPCLLHVYLEWPVRHARIWIVSFCGGRNALLAISVAPSSQAGCIQYNFPETTKSPILTYQNCHDSRVSRFPRLLRPDPCPGTAAQIQQGSTPHIPTKAENRHLHEIVTLLSISFSIDRCVANGTHTHIYIYVDINELISIYNT